jgi:hypothetical protein
MRVWKVQERPRQSSTPMKNARKTSFSLVARSCRLESGERKKEPARTRKAAKASRCVLRSY